MATGQSPAPKRTPTWLSEMPNSAPHNAGTIARNTNPTPAAMSAKKLAHKSICFSLFLSSI